MKDLVTDLKRSNYYFDIPDIYRNDPGKEEGQKGHWSKSGTNIFPDPLVKRLHMREDLDVKSIQQSIKPTGGNMNILEELKNMRVLEEVAPAAPGLPVTHYRILYFIDVKVPKLEFEGYTDIQKLQALDEILKKLEDTVEKSRAAVAKLGVKSGPEVLKEVQEGLGTDVDGQPNPTDEGRE